jgi:hypothetical protein
MRHAGRHNETAQLFCLIHLDLDHEFSTGRDSMVRHIWGG